MSCCVAVLFVLGSIAPSITSSTGADATSPDFTPPRVVAARQTVPVYPPAALAGRFEGLVELRATVRADGTVGEVEIVSCDHPRLGFEQASRDAVRTWRFEPAQRAGEPIAAATTLRVSFRAAGPGRVAYVTVGSASGSPATYASTPRSTAFATIAAKR
jgi:TonB family protein